MEDVAFRCALHYTAFLFFLHLRVDSSLHSPFPIFVRKRLHSILSSHLCTSPHRSQQIQPARRLRPASRPFYQLAFSAFHSASLGGEISFALHHTKACQSNPLGLTHSESRIATRQGINSSFQHVNMATLLRWCSDVAIRRRSGSPLSVADARWRSSLLTGVQGILYTECFRSITGTASLP